MLEGALTDLKVVELSERVAGPFCTKVMADLGAKVIKLEKPGTGDVARTHGPFRGTTRIPKRARASSTSTQTNVAASLTCSAAWGA